MCWTTVSTHALVKIATDVTAETFVTQFEDCLFDALNGGATLAYGIVDGATETHHQILFRGQNDFLNCDVISDPLTYCFTHAQEADVSGLRMTVVAES